MKQLLIILSLVLGCLQPGYTQKPVLKFNKDGKFKIVQFTDVHYIHGNPKSAVSLERINEVLDAEKVIETLVKDNILRDFKTVTLPVDKNEDEEQDSGEL